MNSALLALLVFSLLAALYLVHLGIRGELVSVLLWPAAATHAGLAILLAALGSREMDETTSPLPVLWACGWFPESVDATTGPIRFSRVIRG